jgi:hypothetical protein
MTLQGYSSQRKVLIDASLAVNTRFSPFFFRNLTSFDFSGYCSPDQRFVVALLGPLGSNRTKIVQVSLNYPTHWILSSYLLEAFNRLSWFAELETYRAILDDPPAGDRDLGFLESLKESCTYEGLDFNEEEEDKLHEIAQRLAPSNYSIFRTMNPASFFSADCLSEVLHTRDRACHPFNNLQTLTIDVSYIFELYLIFYSSLFPFVTHSEAHRRGTYHKPVRSRHQAFPTRHYRVSQAFQASLSLCNSSPDVRSRSIDRLEGTVIPPENAEERMLDTLLSPSTWVPLKADEIANEPRIDYFGPKLSQLDLQGLLFLDMQE